MINYLFFYVNGKEIIDYHVEPEWTLLWYLRNKLRLTGSKLGCGEGGCGACTVLVSRLIDKKPNEIEHRTINACLTSICGVDGCHVITVEGLGSINKSNLHPVQRRLAELSGSQCGFCTPGMIMSLYGTLTTGNSSLPLVQDIEESFDGNLCRCTGYRPILDAAKTFASDINQIYHKNSLLSSETSTTYDKCHLYAKQNSEIMNPFDFPEKLREYIPQSLHIQGSVDWYRPVTLSELFHLRSMYSGNQSKLIFGNTTVQIESRYQKISYPRLITITHITELQEIKRTQDSLLLGAGITFSQLKSKLIEWTNDDNSLSACQALLDQLKHFASIQIRNVASLGGNIISASPISDINPVLIAIGAILEFHSANRPNVRKVLLSDFYLGDHRVSMLDNEVLVTIHIPIFNSPINKYFLRSYKQARRRDDSKGIVSAAFQVELQPLKINNDQKWKIISTCFSFGGMASKTIVATNTQRQLIGLFWTKQTMNQVYDLLLKDMVLDELSPGGMPKFKQTLVQSFFFKFYSYVCNKLSHQPINDRNILYFNRPVSHAQQTIPERPKSQKIVGSSLPHCTAYLHTTGEAMYVDDMPSLIHTHYGAFVLSTKANARIKHIDISEALKVPAIIGVVVGKTEDSARSAADLIHIEYELLIPRIFSINDAIDHQSYFGDELCLNKGDVEKCFHNAEHILEDTIYIGGQEHFYMETNSFIVIPSHDDQEITLYSGTQTLAELQELAALVLNRDSNRITCRVKRIGGAFGGKESRCAPLCLAVAVAAVKVACPVRLTLERHTDISITGQRHPFKIHYRVAFTDQGHFQGLDIQMWSNAGCTVDLSKAVMECAMLHMGNCYQFPNIRIRGYVCKTHLPSNTAFRGFGGPQAIFGCETVVEHVAAYLKRDSYTIRCLNLFQEGDMTHYGQVLQSWNIPRILNQLCISSDFDQRQSITEEFNHQNIYRKRGISILPVKFGIGFTNKFLNQAGALVHIYKDGTVLLTHSGIEMGQGLHMKMMSIASEVLHCDINSIHISETSTDKIPNMTPTSGSVSSDLNGMAIKNACEQLRQRLDAFIGTGSDDITWKNLIEQAYYARVDLSAHGFYATPYMFDADFSSNRATFNYFTQGGVVTEIELDILTGDWHILRVDILMDVGISLNPQIDIGQIEGGFMQGVGLFTMEEVLWGDNKQNTWIEQGKLAIQGPDTYKIPSFSDVPLDFRVSLLSDSSNPRAVYSSKGIGEPPLILGLSTFFALKQACTSYRKQQGAFDYFTFHSPATVERLRMACTDQFTCRTHPDTHETFPSKDSD
ncbi:hypothetical protein I4U23_014479 [Adineta vaga]|nr:hypothetical protein I4U23_014479 [Adineta vaga]